MSDDRTITDDERIDDNDVSAAGLVKRLEKVGNIVGKVNSRLDKIKAVMGVPPDDNKPAILATLADIKAKSQITIDTAVEMETMLRSVGPDGG